MKLTKPLISIAMCTYNGEQYVREQIQSICQQTYNNIEIIIVDDNSSDKTIEIASSIAKYDNRIKIHKNDINIGYNKNFEKACCLTSGEFIAIADQDDVWGPDKIEILYNYIKTHEDILLVHGLSMNYLNNKKQIAGIKNITRITNYDLGNSVQHFFLQNRISGHNILMRKKLFKLACPYPDDVYYDWWLCAVAACNGKLRFVKQILTWHRIHDNNVSGAIFSLKKMTIKEQLILLHKWFQRLSNITEEDKKISLSLLTHYEFLKKDKFSLLLFLFIIKRSRRFFASKKRLIPYFSYIKNAFRYAHGKSYLK